MNLYRIDLKKVLLSINNNILSGIELFTTLLAENLDKDKYNVTIAIPEPGPICKLLDEKKLSYFVFNNKQTGSHTLKGIYYIFKNIFKNKYDIIHAQAGIVPCIMGKLTGCPLLLEHKHGLDYTSDQLNSMGKFKLFYEKSKKYFTDYTLTVCESDKKILLDKFAYKDHTVKTIYNGINISMPAERKKSNNKKVIGTIGRLTFQKGQEFLIYAAKNLLNKGLNFEFHIYGDGEKFEEYKNLINKLELKEIVFLKGFTNDIESSIYTFDLFVLPSRYEGIPYVILYAMGLGLPIIASNVGGISEIIKDGMNGVLVEKENSDIISDKIQLLMNDENLRTRVANNAKKDFFEKYTLDKTIRDVEKLYSKVSKS